MHRVTSNLRIFISIIQSHSLANGRVMRERAYMSGLCKEEKPLKLISHQQLSYISNNSNKMCYRNVTKYSKTNGKIVFDNFLHHEKQYPLIQKIIHSIPV